MFASADKPSMLPELFVACSPGAPHLCAAPVWIATCSVVQLAWILLIAKARLPALLGRRPLGKASGARQTDMLRAAHVVCAALIAASYAALLILDDADELGDAALRPLFLVGRSSALGAWLVCLGLGLAEARVRRGSSGALRLWCMATLVLSGLALADDLAAEHALESTTAKVRVAASALCILLGVGAFFAPAADDAADDALLLAEAKPARHPISAASFASLLTFAWMWPVLSLGVRRPLEQTDMFELARPTGTTEYHARRFDRAWARRPVGKGSFICALHGAFGAEVWAMGALELVRVGFVFANPVLSQAVIRYLDSGGESMDYASAILCAVGIFAANVAWALIQGQYNWKAWRMCIHTQAAVGQAVFEKSLRLAFDERTRFGIGPIVSYIARHHVARHVAVVAGSRRRRRLVRHLKLRGRLLLVAGRHSPSRLIGGELLLRVRLGPAQRERLLGHVVNPLEVRLLTAYDLIRLLSSVGHLVLVEGEGGALLL